MEKRRRGWFKIRKETRREVDANFSMRTRSYGCLFCLVVVMMSWQLAVVADIEKRLGCLAPVSCFKREWVSLDS